MEFALTLLAALFLFLAIRGLPSLLGATGAGQSDDRLALARLEPSERRCITKLARSKAKIEDHLLAKESSAACRVSLATLDQLQRNRW